MHGFPMHGLSMPGFSTKTTSHVENCSAHPAGHLGNHPAHPAVFLHLPDLTEFDARLVVIICLKFWPSTNLMQPLDFYCQLSQHLRNSCSCWWESCTFLLQWTLWLPGRREWVKLRFALEVTSFFSALPTTSKCGVERSGHGHISQAKVSTGRLLSFLSGPCKQRRQTALVWPMRSGRIL